MIESAGGPLLVLDGPHFCASKLEAFFSRGEDDLYHHDLEDFIAVVDGRPSLISEIQASPKELREFLEVNDQVTSAAIDKADPASGQARPERRPRKPRRVGRTAKLAGLPERSAATA